ncbi:innexin [Trichonephila clavata]|uniref:Innexin n=1 Tax=Trichonephila clavata TaxID=2740835 RepID=A0A8X6HPN3_TRICU|nr:innexin [Trichonephila clavata]
MSPENYPRRRDGSEYYSKRKKPFIKDPLSERNALSFHLPFRLYSKTLHSYVQELTIQKVEPSEYDRVFQVITASQGHGMFWKLWTLECVYAAHLLCQIVLLNVFFHRVWSLSSWSWSVIPMLFPDMGTASMTIFQGEGKRPEGFVVYSPE